MDVRGIELKKNISNLNIIIFIIFLFFFNKIAFGDDLEETYLKGGRIFHQIKKKEIKNSRENWDRAAEYFLKVILMKKSERPRTIDAYYSLGICRMNTENYLKGVINFRNLIKTSPRHRLADDAQYLTGFCFLRRKEEKQALLEFERVIYHYPKGDMVTKALNEIEKLYEKYPDKKREIKLFRYLSRKSDNRHLIFKYKQKIKSIEKTIQDDTTIENKLPVAPVYDKGNPKYIGFRFSSSQQSSRLVVEFDQIPKIKHNYLKNRNTIYIDFENSIINRKTISEKIDNGIISSIKMGQFDKKTVRLSVYLDQDVNYHVFKLDNPPRVVLDVSLGEKKTSPKDDISIVSQLGLKVSTVVIDPGHGGGDPGTCYGKYQEKNIVMSVSKKLYNLLKKDPEYQPILTRNTDEYLYLEERTESANTANGDLFISLHVNSHTNGYPHGIETYYLSLTDDKWSRQLAAKENSSTNLRINDLNDLLNNLLINSKLNESIKFAEIIHSELLQKTKANDRGIKKAPFVVLIGADMPSILVEIGFISNSNERKKILLKSYQDKIAQAIYQGIKSYSESLN